MPPIAAAPQYITDQLDYAQLPPGHAFNLFFPIWNSPDWSRNDNAKTEALKQILKSLLKQAEPLLARQQHLASQSPQVLAVHAQSQSPFMTGTGLEHPLENGFAFLNPYGLPYLAGSSVKGVLRQTARLLVSGEIKSPKNWTQALVDLLFGLESEEHSTIHRRGALNFWDVLIQPSGLGIEILTPHQSHYLQGQATPHDSGQPIPVPFLVVKPNSKFNFFIEANPALVAGCPDWREWLQDCFEHCFDWLAFGAKTAVGYGVLAKDQKAEQRFSQQQAAAAEQAQRAQMSPNQCKIIDAQSWIEKQEPKQPNTGCPLFQEKIGPLLLEADTNTDGSWSADDKKALAEALSVKQLEKKFTSLGKKEKDIKALLRRLRGEA